MVCLLVPPVVDSLVKVVKKFSFQFNGRGQSKAGRAEMLFFSSELLHGRPDAFFSPDRWYLNDTSISCWSNDTLLSSNDEESALIHFSNDTLDWWWREAACRVEFRWVTTKQHTIKYKFLA
jgi:hypothetical protein